jgi:hypothetical protein
MHAHAGSEWEESPGRTLTDGIIWGGAGTMSVTRKRVWTVLARLIPNLVVRTSSSYEP